MMMRRAVHNSAPACVLLLSSSKTHAGRNKPTKTTQQSQDDDGASIIDKLFGIRTVTRLKAEEGDEELHETGLAYALKCNIANDTNHLAQGLALGLVEDREKNSAALGRSVLFKGSSKIAALPPFLTVQMMRFFYKPGTGGQPGNKAKILRKVAFPAELDAFEFCSDELRAALEAPRAALKEWEDEQVELKKRAPKQQKLGNGSAAAGGGSGGGGGDAEMADAAAAASSSGGGGGHTGAFTGRYQLSAVLTHKGRSADSGHYVAWVRQADGSWALFDDDKITPKTLADVLELSGGGDWHMAYLLLYSAVRAPAAGDGATAGAGAAAAAAAKEGDASKAAENGSGGAAAGGEAAPMDT